MPSTTFGRASASDEPSSVRTKRAPARKMYLCILTLAGLALSAACLKLPYMTFAWMGLCWTMAFVLGIFGVRRAVARVMLLNAAVLSLGIATAEWYICRHEDDLEFSPGYRVQDEVLGWAPAKNNIGHERKTNRGNLIFDATYTIDENGLRIPPPWERKASAGSMVFFGCSDTFGEGLQDTETVPYQVGLQTGGRYRIYNFGFHAYGAHQMLAAIQSGRVRDIVSPSPRYAIYIGLPAHVARGAGKLPYGRHGPKYELQPDGSVSLLGHFDDGRKPPRWSRWEKEWHWQLGKSGIYRTLVNRQPDITEQDVQLMLATVRASRDQLQQQYPGIQFHVILWFVWPNWKQEQMVYRELQGELRKMEIPVHLVEDMLPDYRKNPEKYWLTPWDRHANALADQLIAKYISNYILASQPVGTATASTRSPEEAQTVHP